MFSTLNVEVTGRTESQGREPPLKLGGELTALGRASLEIGLSGPPPPGRWTLALQQNDGDPGPCLLQAPHPQVIGAITQRSDSRGLWFAFGGEPGARPSEVPHLPSPSPASVSLSVADDWFLSTPLAFIFSSQTSSICPVHPKIAWLRHPIIPLSCVTQNRGLAGALSSSSCPFFSLIRHPGLQSALVVCICELAAWAAVAQSWQINLPCGCGHRERGKAQLGPQRGDSEID